MFLPIGDEPNARGAPVINLTLIGVNVLVFVLISLPVSRNDSDPVGGGPLDRGCLESGP